MIDRTCKFPVRFGGSRDLLSFEIIERSFTGG